MIRRTWIGALLVGSVIGLTGCEAKPGGSMTKETAEKDLADRLYYTDVKLTDEGSGRFVGTALDNKGELANVEVSYSGNTVKWKSSYKSADGRITRESSGSTAR